MSAATLSADDLRYLSTLAWRQGTRRAEDIADRIDALLKLASASPPSLGGADEPHPAGMSHAEWGGYEQDCLLKTRGMCSYGGPMCESAAVRIPAAPRKRCRWCPYLEEEEAERRRQADARKHFDVV